MLKTVVYPRKLLLTSREKKVIISGKSKTLHCTLVVGYGVTTISILKVPYADDTTATITTNRC